MKKPITLVFILALAASSLIMMENASAQSTQKLSNAQTITKPSIPEFTTKYFDFSYDVAPVYGIDPNTDERVIKQQGYHVDNRSIQFTIKNQPFTPFTESSNGRTIDLFYNIKYRFSGADWASMFGGDRQIYAGSSGDVNFDPYLKYGYPIQNYTAQYTIITYTLPSEAPHRGQIDFQVQALEGYTNCTQIGESHIFLAFVNYSFFGEKSGWTSTQTVAYPEENFTTTPSPTVPEFSFFSIMTILAVIPLIAIFLGKKRICLKAKSRSKQ